LLLSTSLGQTTLKKVPSTQSLDLRLTVTPILDENEQKRKARFLLETTRAFASFVYDLSVKETIVEHHIHWKVNGLKPPRLSIPASGRARFERMFDDLTGEYDLTIEGLDGSKTAFGFKFQSGNVHLLRAPDKGFVELILNATTTSST
jgi:hypothetical protein